MELKTISQLSKMKKIILLITILAIAAAALGYYYYTKPRAGVSGMKPEFAFNAAALYETYAADENAANAKYLGRVLEVSGIVKALETDDRGTMNVSLESGDEMGAVSCQFEKKDQMPELKAGDAVVLKGICSGLLMDVVLVDCEIIK
jgi:hypothetical protein